MGTDKHTDRRTDERAGGRTEKQADRRRDRETNGWTDWQTDRQAQRTDLAKLVVNFRNFAVASKIKSESILCLMHFVIQRTVLSLTVQIILLVLMM
jgi:hypothetical protein